MNRIFIGLATFILLSCSGGAGTKKADLKNELVVPAAYPSGNVLERSLNLQESEIIWKATKLLGTAGHIGVVNLKEGKLYFKNERLVGGKIVVDLNTIRITDTNEYGEETMARLSAHLKKKEFNTGKYPLATFEITSVKYLKNNQLQVNGNMTIKDITREISVPALVERSGLSSKFIAELKLNRKNYNIGIDGNLLEKNLVDDEFEIHIKLITLQ